MTNIETALSLFKTALGITHTARDTYFRSMLEARAAELEKSGVTLDSASVEDNMFLADYAEWTYKNRDSEKTMPEHLRLRLNNRKVKARAETIWI
jgi:hypothetical protein